jgi:hypothetical protein
MRAFADALDAVPMALAENSGLSPIETLADIKSRQAKEKNTRLGVDCMQTGSNGMSPDFFNFPRPLRFSAFSPDAFFPTPMMSMSNLALRSRRLAQLSVSTPPWDTPHASNPRCDPPSSGMIGRVTC